MNEELCNDCKHEEKYHATINFAFHKQYGCHILEDNGIRCTCQEFVKVNQEVKNG